MSLTSSDLRIVSQASMSSLVALLSGPGAHQVTDDDPYGCSHVSLLPWLW